MFCKFCGQPVVGTKCSSCGKEMTFVAHSTELEKMMAAKRQRQPVADPQRERPTYEQGYDAGYEKGLSDGYINGQKDVPLPPAPRFPWKKTAVLCGAVFIISAAASGLIFRNLGYQSGLIQGAEEGSLAAEEAASRLEKQYQQGFATGKAEGLQDGERKGFEEGKAAGKAETEKKYLQEKYRKEHSNIPNPGGTERPEDRILFSEEKNGGKRSAEVAQIQSKLYELGMFERSVEKEKAADGLYGRKTKEAVIRFQEEKGLITEDNKGKIDRATYDALMNEPSPETESQEDSQGKEDDGKKQPEKQETEAQEDSSENREDGEKQVKEPEADPASQKQSPQGTFPDQKEHIIQKPLQGFDSINQL